MTVQTQIAAEDLVLREDLGPVARLTLNLPGRINPLSEAMLTRLQAGRRWTWIEGNHDPGPVELGGSHRNVLTTGPLTFRHIAEPGAVGEVSGHYHPKAQVKTRLRRISRPAFLVDGCRVILPAFGTFTGGLRSCSAELSGLMQPDALAILTGSCAHAVPMPR